MRSCPADLQGPHQSEELHWLFSAEQGDLQQAPIQTLVVSARVSPDVCCRLGLCI